MRQASVERNTKETQIKATVNLDGTGCYTVSTGIGFLDHMLEQLSRHSLMDLTVEATGDLHIDFHHTTEDTAICIGEAVAKALGERKGIARYGAATIPMDETLTEVAIDLSNRPYLIWEVAFSKPKLGEMDTELFKEWFQPFPRRRAPRFMCGISTARITIILSSPASRALPERCARRRRLTRGRPIWCRPPKGHWAEAFRLEVRNDRHHYRLRIGQSAVRG